MGATLTVNGDIGLLVGSPPSLPLTAPIFSDAWWLDPVAGVPLTAGIAPFQAAVAAGLPATAV